MDVVVAVARHLTESGLKMKTKVRKEKRDWLSNIGGWSVTKHGICLYINPAAPTSFSSLCALDIEDDERGNFVGIGIFDGTSCYYWSDWELVSKLTIPPFIAHNGRTDLDKLKKWGFKVDESFLIYDTQLMAHIIDSSRRMYGLKALAKADLGIEYPSYEELTGKKTSKDHVTLDKLDLTLVAEYNACDCYSTYKLFEKQRDSIAVGMCLNTQHYYETLEKPSAFVFQAMEQRGIMLDIPYATELQAKLKAQKEPIKAAIENELGAINLNSPKQLLGALNAKGIKPFFKGKGSTDKRALDSLRHLPIVRDLLSYSEIETLLSSFVEPYLQRQTEVVRPHYNQCGTRTGRPSCSDPNLLQIPRRTENGRLVRRMFIARPGHLFGDADFGQIEPRLLAHFSKDEKLCRLFNEGSDFHNFTASNLGIDRERAKILNLSVGYRATYKSVGAQLKCRPFEAQEEIDRWWAMFPDLWDWQQKLIYESKKTGYCTTLMGRRIKVEDLEHGNQWRREGAERQLINNIIQGSAAEVMKLGMIACDKAGINLLVQIYDELLYEEKEADIEAATEVVIQCMEKAVKLDVPLVVEAHIGPNWSEVH